MVENRAVSIIGRGDLADGGEKFRVGFYEDEKLQREVEFEVRRGWRIYQGNALATPYRYDSRHDAVLALYNHLNSLAQNPAQWVH